MSPFDSGRGLQNTLFVAAKPEPEPFYKVSSMSGPKGWVHWVVSLKPQRYKDPKRVEWEKEAGPFSSYPEAQAALATLQGP